MMTPAIKKQFEDAKIQYFSGWDIPQKIATYSQNNNYILNYTDYPRKINLRTY